MNQHVILLKIKKIRDFFRYRVLAKKIWYWPRRSDVLIFDASGYEYLSEYLLPWNPEVLHIRGEQINMLVLFTSLFRIGKRSQAYVDCYIQRVQPRLIVTFIDNNVSFYTISQRYPNIKTLFIQNGLRSFYADIFETLDTMNQDFCDKLKVDYMLTFGQVSGNTYNKYIKGNVVPMGSIKNNSLIREKTVKNNVIAFVSQWQKEGIQMGVNFFTDEDFFGQSDRPVIQCLVHYAKENHKQFSIIPRYHPDNPLRSQEEKYYHRILGYTPEFLEPNAKYPAYKAIDIADVIVTIDSTLGYESIARGNKTAIFSIRGSVLNVPGISYGWPENFPDDGLFWTNSLNKDSFVHILDYLFSTNETQWQKDVDVSGFSSLMIHDPGNTIFKSLIEKELGPSPLLAFVQPNSGVPDKSRVY